MYKRIFVNQCGYLPGQSKYVTFRSEKPVSFSVVRSDGERIFQGTASFQRENPSAGEVNYVGEFSAVTNPGLYYITVDSLGESDTFEIGPDIYENIFQNAFSFFYLQRCGCDLPENAAAAYAHRACHTKPAIIYGNNTRKDVSGGWHDAGDYGRYVVPGAMAAAQLLYAFEDNPELTAKYRSPQAADNSLPAYLEEIKYELDWMLKMQREDGQLYHKATCHRFCGFIMPDREDEDLVLSPVSVTATADFAAVAAMAVRFYQPYDPAYADRLTEASQKAYTALKGMELSGGFKNPPDIYTGEYGDPCDIDERYWAAAELYKTFGNQEYREDFERLASRQVLHGYGWSNMGSYGNRAYLTTEHATDPELRDRIAREILALADEKLQIASSDGYGVSLTSGQYVWGSNMNVANNGLHLLDAYRLLGNTKYLDVAADQLNYLLGRNPMGLCYLTGCGTNPIKHPHHRPSGYLGKAMPGMLSGGPCSGRQDQTAASVLPENVPPAKALVDMTGSYSTNEVAIYWNSAFVQLLANICRAYR